MDARRNIEIFEDPCPSFIICSNSNPLNVIIRVGLILKFNNSCKHESAAPVKLMETLKLNQGGEGRHKCCFCAFKAGLSSPYSREGLLRLIDIEPSNFYKCPHDKIAPKTTLTLLPQSQGGIVRHRCATCAYWRGLSSVSLGEQAKPFNLFLTHFELDETMWSPKIGGGKSSGQVDAIGNAKIGLLGELATISYEKEFLAQNNLHELSEGVEHVSQTEGDSVGYDVRSYNLDGTDKWIEVKTTTGSLKSFFHISENQILVSEMNPQKFNLYRIYDFDPEQRKGSFYHVSGNMRSKLVLQSNSYKALPK